MSPNLSKPDLSLPLPTLHATTVAMRLGGEWAGVLIQGPSGAGKSDLALRAIAQGWRLVADDRSLVWVSGGRLFARAPAALAGLMEVRGLGVLPHPALEFVPLRLSVVLESTSKALERLPESEFVQILGLNLPQIRLFALESSAVAKLGAALASREARLGETEERAYQAAARLTGDMPKARGGSTGNV